MDDQQHTMQSLQRFWLRAVRVLGIIILIVWMLSSPALAASSQNSGGTTQGLRQGVAAFQDGNYAEAASFFSQVIEQKPDHAVAYGNRCLSYLELKRYENAIADCTMAIELASDSTVAFVSEAFLNRGLAHYRSRQIQNAIADYTQVLQQNVHDYRALYNRGLAYADFGHYDEALQDYHQAVQQTPIPKEALTLIRNDEGIAYLMLDKPMDAIAAFNQAIQLNTSDIRAFFNRGCAYHRIGKEPLALHDFNQVIALDPTHAQAYLHRGLIQIHMGQTEDAIASLTDAAQQFRAQDNLGAYERTQQLIHQLQFPSGAFG